MNKTLRNVAAVTAPTLLFIFLLGELMFRFVMPACQTPQYSFNGQYGFLSFEQRAASGQHTFGAFTQKGGKWRLNNYYWNSDIDYFPGHSSKTRIAVIGASYVEALHVNQEDTFFSLINKAPGSKYELYAFGISGMASSAYSRVAAYADETFSPDMFIIVLRADNIAASVKGGEGSPYQQRLEVGKGDAFKLVPAVPFRPSGPKRFLAHFAVARYLICNLGIRQLGKRALSLLDGKGEPAASQPVDKAAVPGNAYRISKISLDLLKQAVHGKRLIALLDGDRPGIYSPGASDPAYQVAHTAFLKAAAEADVAVINLQEVFERDYREHHLKFEFDIDSHWNSHAHRLAALEVQKYLEKHMN